MKTPNVNGASNCNTIKRRKHALSSLVLVSTFSIALLSCSEGHYEQMADESSRVMADSISGIVSSNAAVVGKADSTHTFIRTADIKFKVKDVKQSTFDIEDLVSRHGGYITYTNLSSNISYINKIQTTEDSTLEATHFNVDNSLTIRVPNTHLDSVLRGMAHLMDFLDHRTIKADDIKYTLLSTQLAAKRYKEHKQRFTKAIDTKGKKLKETVNAEDELLVKENIVDNSQIETLELMDKVNYSTVTLYIYQPETIKYTSAASDKMIVPYEPGFGKRLGAAFKDGWNIFENIILFFVNIWGVLVLMVALFFGIRWMVLNLGRSNITKA